MSGYVPPNPDQQHPYEGAQPYGGQPYEAQSYGGQSPYSAQQPSAQPYSASQPSYGQQPYADAPAPTYDPYPSSPGYSQPYASGPSLQPYQPTPYGTPGVNPGQNLGIAGLLVSLLAWCIPFGSIIGLVLSIIGLQRSRAVGMGNGVAIAGIIVSGLSIAWSLLWIVVTVLGSFAQ